jgi:hypothetical protein
VPVKKLLLLLSKLCGETLVRDTDPSSPARRFAIFGAESLARVAML